MASFSIEFEQGGQTQQTSFESESISIGRDRSSDFILDHPTVSRQHALIVHQGSGNFQLVVLSRGGLTAVDGTPVESSEVRLYDGSGITLGKYTVRFRSHLAPPKPASTPNAGAVASPESAGGGSPAEAAQPEAAQDESEKQSDGPDIMSWDEIAASPEANEGTEQAEVEPTNFERIQKAKKEEEGSNPLVIVVGLAMAAGLLGFTLFGGGSSGGGDGSSSQGPSFEDQEPVVVSVSCLDPADCEEQAYHNYKRALDLIEQRAVETRNLFEGYERLLIAEAYLKEAGIESIPEDMDQWHEKHDMARSDLDSRFNDLRMRYHQAQQRSQYREMATILDEIQAYFPEEKPEQKVREYRWAQQRERQMKSQGTYPRR